MCKLKKYHNTSNTQVDKCIRNLIRFIKEDTHLEVIASCCGHGKYPITIVCRDCDDVIFDLVSDTEIPRKRRFYKKDKQGYYYITEVSK